jgi:hypothetical protein
MHRRFSEWDLLEMTQFTFENNFRDAGDLMKLVENDFEESYFQSIRRGNDKTVSYLFVCIALLMFFALFLFGVNRAQSFTDPASNDANRLARDHNPEIGVIEESTGK